MDLRTFLSVLLLYRHNFQVLHWMADGESFLTIHAQAEKYYKLLSDDIDKVAEMILRDYNEIISYKDVLDITEESDHDFLLMTGKELCDMVSFAKYSEQMFNDLKKCIELLFEKNKKSDDIGIVSELENIYNEYDLQVRYIIKRLSPNKK